jgi:predicted ATPase
VLTEIRLENFKCFGPEVVIPVGDLNLLTGINAKGKSTTLQSLLVLHQSIDRALAGARLLERIELNGRYARLGAFREVRHRDRPKSDPVRIGLEFSDPNDVTTTTRLALRQSDDEARWAGIGRIEVEKFADPEVIIEDSRQASESQPFLTLDFREQGVQYPDALALASGLARLGRVHYVSADRLGPQDFFTWSNDTDFLAVGVRGERTAEVLHQAGREQRTIEDKRAREESETLLLTDQASAWLSYVFDGGKVRVVAPHSTILTLEMNADGSAHYHRPVNVGFGYSYVLPILLAGLLAHPGEILIIENPEAHLHPLAQSRIGEFLATVSSAGVQVFVESHSDHILNAFRLAVKESRIAQKALSLLYFRRHEVEPIIRVAVEPDGRIPHWPDGFFDQRTQDFFRLFEG